MKHLKTIIIVIESLAIVALVLYAFDQQVEAVQNATEARRQFDNYSQQKAMVEELQEENTRLAVRMDSIQVLIDQMKNEAND